MQFYLNIISTFRRMFRFCGVLVPFVRQIWFGGSIDSIQEIGSFAYLFFHVVFRLRTILLIVFYNKYFVRTTFRKPRK